MVRRWERGGVHAGHVEVGLLLVLIIISIFYNIVVPKDVQYN